MGSFAFLLSTSISGRYEEPGSGCRRSSECLVMAQTPLAVGHWAQ